MIWLAEYRDKATYGGTYGMWQYTSSGRISGIEGKVDFNLCYLDFGTEEEKEETLDDPNQTGEDNPDEDPDR